jgi:hypothetical protein
VKPGSIGPGLGGFPRNAYAGSPVSGNTLLFGSSVNKLRLVAWIAGSTDLRLWTMELVSVNLHNAR